MKNKILFIAILVAVLTVVLTATAFAEIEITKCEISEDGKGLCLEGTASEPGRRVTLEIIRSTVSDSDISAMKEGNIASLFENIFEFTTDAESKFSAETKLRGNSGFYTIRAKELGESEVSVFEDAFYFASSKDEDAVVSKINGADTKEEMNTALSEVYKSLYIPYGDFELFKDDEKDAVASFVLESKEDDFENISDVSKCFGMGILLTELKKSDNALASFEEKMKYIGFSEGDVLCDAFTGILSKSDREKIINAFTKEAPYDNMEKATFALYDAIILKSIEECDNYMEVEKLFEGLKDYFGNKMKNYNKYSSKSKITKAVVGKSFADTDEFFDFIDKKIRQMSEDKTTGGGSSSGGGGGGGSVTVSNTAPSTQQILPQTPAQPVQPESKEPFGDLASYSWAKESINTLFEKGIISGKGEGVFAPSDFVTREEFVKMIIGAFFKLSEDAESRFDDVDKGRWSYHYISTALSNGIVLGKSDFLFGATDKISRQDAAVIIKRCIKDSAVADSDGESFKDAEKISQYAFDAVTFMKNAGIILGREDGGFYPLDNLSRAEAAVIINRAMNYKR